MVILLMTEDDQRRFGEVRALVAEFAFRDAYKATLQIEDITLRDAARGYIEVAIRNSEDALAAASERVTFREATTPRCADLLERFYFDDPPPHTLAHQPIDDTMLLFFEISSRAPTNPAVSASLLLDFLTTSSPLSWLVTEPRTSRLHIFEHHIDSSIIRKRAPQLLVDGLLLEQPYMDARPELARSITDEFIEWCGADARYFTGQAVNHPDYVCDEILIGVNQDRAVVLWVLGYD